MADYECDGCGVCCRSYLIFASEADATREPRIADEGRKLAEHLATPEWVYQLFPLPFHQACCFIDESARCTIYEGRPDVCRAFAAGGDQCQAARLRAGLPPLEPVGQDARDRAPLTTDY
jgi:Fe-S-cluster containining protein